MIKKLLTVAIMLMMVVSFASAQDYSSDPALGVWMSINEEDVATCYWTLYLQDGKLFGKLLYAIGESVDSTLEECEATYKDYPVEGNVAAMPLLDTVLLYNMIYKEAGYWWKGRIIDPEDGKLYYVKVYLDGDKMFMKGSIDKRGFIGRKQVWKKSSMERAMEAKANLE